ncbi:MAG: carboxypeptidase-like regulatory domain-containing protein, partial [Ilumatobacteraceae bacterium]
VSGIAFTTQPVVIIVDSGGNTVTSSVTVTATASGGTLSGSTSVAAVNGVAAFGNLTITGAAGTYSLTFSASGLGSATSASFALTVAAVPSETEAVTKVLSPTVDNKIDVQVQGTSTTANLNISINIPKNSLTEETTVNVFSNSQIADIDAGFVSIRIESNRTSDNSEVTTFANAIEIRIPTTAVGASPAWSRDGLTWTLLPRLTEAFLPEGQLDGYFVNADGSYSFFTRHLTTFGLMRTQAPLTLTSSNSGLKVHENVQLLYSGGTGSGAIMFKSKNPKVCSVSSGGIVAGLSIGECSVTVSKLGWGSYLDATSAPAVFSISAVGLTNTFEGSTFSFKRHAGRTTIKVSMPMKYANKLIKIEWGVKKGGSVFYGSWGNTRANSAGVATLSTSKIITLNTFVKASLGSKIIAKRGVFANLSP